LRKSGTCQEKNVFFFPFELLLFLTIKAVSVRVTERDLFRKGMKNYM
jgi:hypothetical protein